MNGFVLFFAVSATVSRPSNKVTAIEDDHVVLVCTAKGYPAPHVAWIAPNGTVLQNQTTDTNLTLPNVSRHSSGTYQCNATNKLGSDSATVELDVLCKFLSLWFFLFIWKLSGKRCGRVIWWMDCLAFLLRLTQLQLSLMGCAPSFVLDWFLTN